jgi:hypothetical protein
MISRRRAPVELGAAEDERQPMAALGFVHVVRRDEHGRALGRDAMDVVPELATAHGIDAGGGLVEEEERRRVDRRAGERDALLPAARERAGDLLTTCAEADRFDTRRDTRRDLRAADAVDATA